MRLRHGLASSALRRERRVTANRCRSWGGLFRLAARGPFAIPGTPGVPESATALTRVLPYNDRDAVTALFAELGDRIACLITEAAPGNMGVVPPDPGFNRSTELSPESPMMMSPGLA